jgi:phage shock protein A
MWKRFMRAIRSIFGGVVNSMEDPKLILEQNIRELNDQIPKMNENIATVKASVMMLEKEVKRYEAQVNEMTAKIRTAIQANRDDIAETYALQLQSGKQQLQSSREQLAVAQNAYEKALQVKKAFMREKDRKIQEAREALRAHERTQWQAKIADAMEQFEVGGLDQTHDEMINRLNERSARNEARMEMALDSIDTKMMEIEVDAEKLRAQELIKQFKLEMGDTTATTPAKPLLDSSDSENFSAGAGKTLGKEKTQ